MDQSCKSCKYYTVVSDQRDNGEGICRRYPPLPLSLGEDRAWATVYTPVKIDGWCGEWEIHPEQRVTTRHKFDPTPDGKVN